MTLFKFHTLRSIWSISLLMLVLGLVACKPETPLSSTSPISPCLQIASNYRIPTQAPIPTATPWEPIYATLNAPVSAPTVPPSPLLTPTFSPSPLSAPKVFPIMVLTPSPLRMWPSPTPTPLPAQAERARRFVSAQQNISLERLSLYSADTVLCPSTSEELWLGRIIDTKEGYYFHVLVDLAGNVAYAPDFSTRAIEMISQREDIPAEELFIGNKAYVVFPVTHQATWHALIVVNKIKDVPEYSVALDLEGQPVDFKALE
jgi:hypothetical protein